MIESKGIYLPFITDIINVLLKRATFPDELNLAEVIPLFKKADHFDKMTYRSVRLLFHILKVFERVIYNQINKYIKPFLSRALTCFCKNHNTKHSLLEMLDNFKEALDKGNSVSAIFMDLSKAFDMQIMTC